MVGSQHINDQQAVGPGQVVGFAEVGIRFKTPQCARQTEAESQQAKQPDGQHTPGGCAVDYPAPEQGCQPQQQQRQGRNPYQQHAGHKSDGRSETEQELSGEVE